jgi:hypothetical protein
MAKEITSEQFWQLYKKLPPEVQESLFSEQTGDSIYNICERNDLIDEHSNIVIMVRNVLLGLLPPDEFQEILQKSLKIEKEKAKKVSRELYRFVFYPVKSDLEDIYEMEIGAAEAEPETKQPTKKEEKKPAVKVPSGAADPYREEV